MLGMFPQETFYITHGYRKTSAKRLLLFKALCKAKQDKQTPTSF